MKIIAKGKSLLTQTSKSKKQDKYSEISSIKTDYKFLPKSKVIYLGTLDKYKGLECTILKRSRRKSTEYYKIKFDDNEEVDGVAGGFLRTLEEYQLELEQLENKCENDISDVSEIERGIIEAGLIPYLNPLSCLDPILFYNRGCDRCKKEYRCVYRNKFNYSKMKFN